jgi:hypothetical protein
MYTPFFPFLKNILFSSVAEIRIHPCIFTHLITPCSRVLREKLTGFQLVKKFPAFYGTRRFITALTNARHLPLSWARSIQSMPPHPTSLKIHLNIILQSRPGSYKWSLSLRFPNQNPAYTSHLPQTCYIPLLSRPSLVWSNEQYWKNSVYFHKRDV